MFGLLRNIKHKTFASLSVHNYRLYFFGQSISVCGTWMQTVALGWLVLQMTGSGAQLGTVVALQFLPLLLLGPFGGLIADRFDKRTVLIHTQSAFGIQALLLGILVFTGAAQIWMLYVLALCYGMVRVVDDPSRHTFVSEMVDSGHIKNAVSLNSMVNNLARAIGPTIGGALIAGAGIAFCFVFNSALRLAVIGMLLLMRKSELHNQHSGPRKSADLIEGFRYVMATPIIRDTLFMMAIVGIFAYEWQVSLPLLARNTFHGDASSYALLMTSFGVGAVLGGLTAASRHTIVPRHVIGYMFLFAFSLIGVAFVPTLHIAMLGILVVGFFSINLTSLANTMIQLESVHEMRGRVMALWTTAMVGSTTIGGPIIGLVGEHLGARWGFIVGGVAALIAGTFAALPLLQERRLLAVTEENADSEIESI